MKKTVTLLSIVASVALASVAHATDTTAKTTLSIKGMTCGGCVAAVKLQLKKTAGVTAYQVSLEKGEADVTYDPAQTDPQKIADSVSTTGFATSVKEADESRKTSSTANAPEPAVKGGRLDPWQPVDIAFAGCSEGVCGMRGRNPQAVVQPGAQPGQYVYCPVSGAVFRIKESSPSAEVHGKTLYLCCDGCARYFAQNREHVLALRGLSL
jgi:copper chaperone CopZ/YHS domain-containing protein